MSNTYIPNAFTTGRVIRGLPGTEPKDMTLIATVSKNGEEVSQQFTAKILPWTHSEIVSNNASILSIDSVLGNNIRANSIQHDLSLPTTGENGATISWNSSNNGVINPETGEVTRPSFSQGDINVTLTATITSGTETTRLEFEFGVIRLDQTPQQRLNEMLNAYMPIILGNNHSWNEITSNLVPPDTPTGVHYSLESSNPSVISPHSGQVTRPSAGGSGNIEVLLTFRLTEGDITATKTEYANVIALPE